MSFTVTNIPLPQSYDQNLQNTSRIKGISTFVASITGFTAAASAVTLTTVAVKGVIAPVTASAIPGDIVFVQPMAALGSNTTIGQPYVSAANQITVPFIGLTTPGATATQNYLVTILHLGQPTGLDS